LHPHSLTETEKEAGVSERKRRRAKEKERARERKQEIYTRATKNTHIFTFSRLAYDDKSQNCGRRYEVCSMAITTTTTTTTTATITK